MSMSTILGIKYGYGPKRPYKQYSDIMVRDMDRNPTIIAIRKAKERKKKEEELKQNKKKIIESKKIIEDDNPENILEELSPSVLLSVYLNVYPADKSQPPEMIITPELSNNSSDDDKELENTDACVLIEKGTDKSGIEKFWNSVDSNILPDVAHELKGEKRKLVEMIIENKEDVETEPPKKKRKNSYVLSSG